MISYKPLQKLLIDRDIKKQELLRMTGISSATMAKLNTNEYVSLEVIDKICTALNCQPRDLLEHIPEHNKDE
ncbi:helix-turn-helix domain-containing protein [Paenibacillus thiaminolyticus]|uniref:helix-turn-helix domain-containing protein n=1 Tax=Paenibacillus thiaminolyticus TaxID=49283 RepID=UPI00254378BE|nr:helix-turn-helix transcriptional regulator [Paenibacillus thiaminolyticus]WII39945.1 helix-turn-helix transcriptional regulator [Paenibacillus thiaminolyticus]